jgi:TRAP-type uncharacterized transport system fused permease subunit
MQYTLAVGAASAVVGIVVGAINTTGVDFKLSGIVTSSAADMATSLSAVLGWIQSHAFSQASIQHFLSLILIAIACILVDASFPTKATTSC